MGGRREGGCFRDGVDRDCKREEIPVFDDIDCVTKLEAGGTMPTRGHGDQFASTDCSI